MNTLPALTGLFFTFSTLVLLIGMMQLFKRVSGLEIQNRVNEMLLERCQNTIIDMGKQLYNLTHVDSQLHPGYVYVVKSSTGYYKIGRTIDFRDRIRTFGVKLPFEVEYNAVIETGDYRLLEDVFHQQFSHKRGDGEWFKLEAHDLLFLSAYTGNILKQDEDNA